MPAWPILLLLLVADDPLKNVPPTLPDVLVKRRAYVEIRRVEVRKTLADMLLSVGRSKGAAQASFRKSRRAADRRRFAGRINAAVALEKRVKKELAETKSPEWLPDLQWSRPTLHACGFVASSEDFSIVVTKIEGPESALCRVRAAPIVFDRHGDFRKVTSEAPGLFRFRIPTAQLLEGKPALLKGVYAITKKEDVPRPGLRRPPARKSEWTVLWTVEPARGGELTALKK